MPQSVESETSHNPAFLLVLELAVICFKFYRETEKMRRRGIFKASVLRELRSDVDRLRLKLKDGLSPEDTLFVGLNEVEREIESVLVSDLKPVEDI